MSYHLVLQDGGEDGGEDAELAMWKMSQLSLWKRYWLGLEVRGGGNHIFVHYILPSSPNEKMKFLMEN